MRVFIGYVAVGVIQAGVRFRHAENFGRFFGAGAVRTSFGSRARDVSFDHDAYESLQPGQDGHRRIVRRTADIDAINLQPRTTVKVRDERENTPNFACTTRVLNEEKRKRKRNDTYRNYTIANL